MPYADLQTKRTYHRNYMKEYIKTHDLTPEQKVNKSAYMKKYAEENADKLSEYQRQRWLKDKEKISARVKAYKQANPEKVSEQKKKDYMFNREQRLASVKKYASEHKEEIKANGKKYRQTPKGRLLTYKKSARVRGYDFDLTTDDFNTMLFSNCHYCGKENANGVDRLDSNIGYYSHNVVPCCSTCNYMKRDNTYDSFIKQVKKIMANLKL